jgi:hypothetical protein
MQTIGNLVWQVHHYTPTPGNNPNGVVSYTKRVIVGIGKLVTSPTKSHMNGMPLRPNEVVEKLHLMHVQIASPEHTTFKQKTNVESPLKNRKILGNVPEDSNKKLIKPTSPIVDESSKLINSSCYLLISKNSQL